MKKKVLLIFVVGLVCFQSYNYCFAQSPKSFKYQAVVRDNSGTLLANHIVNFRISLLKGSSTGTAVYVETQKDTTNQFGLANLKIGSGTLVSGNFANINWGGDTYFVKIELDPNGLTSFQLMGTSQLLSVPYALFAEKTGDDGIWSQSATNINNTNAGNVGVGTATPGTKLDVSGVARVYGLLQVGGLATAYSDGHRGIYVNNSSSTAWELMSLENDNGVRFKVLGNGYVGIGTATPTYMLCVNGTIRAKEIIVNTGWSDFVFAKDYRLMSLKELEKYINTNKHLPEIPSAKEVEENGVQLGIISSKLLQKIEELTLYIIEQDKRIEKLEKDNQALKNLLKK